jgi:hypothetical protein
LWNAPVALNKGCEELNPESEMEDESWSRIGIADF